MRVSPFVLCWMSVGLFACSGGAAKDDTEDSDDAVEDTRDTVNENADTEDSDDTDDTDEEEGTDPDRDTDPDTDDSDTDDSDDTDDTDDTDDSDDTDDTAGPVLPTVDCNALPATPLGLTVMPFGNGYHDVAFDQAGYIYGLQAGDIKKTPIAGPVGVLKPNIGGAEGMDFLANGDLVVSRSTNNTIVRVAPNGADFVMASNIDAYGVTIGPDDNVYVGTGSEVLRINSVTNAVDVLVPSMSNFHPRAVNWSPDLSTMYIVNILGGAPVHSVAVDVNLDPIGTPVVWTTGVGSSWHDGIGVDVCGNLYIPEFWSSGMYKVDPSGTVSTLMNASGTSNWYGHGVEWGNGIGGWRDDAIYFPQPYNGNTVGEMILGVPKRGTTGWNVLNAP